MQTSRSPLRERRRWQTARDIQHVTLELIRKHGYGSVTTEMIAREAGISQRTFFNYYVNKEAAAVGPPFLLEPDALAAFARADGPLARDFATLVRHATKVQTARKDTVRAIDEVARTVPELELAFSNSLYALQEQLCDALKLRLGDSDDRTIRLLARVLTNAMALAFREWGHSDTMSLADAVLSIEGTLDTVGRHLVTA